MLSRAWRLLALVPPLALPGACTAGGGERNPDMGSDPATIPDSGAPDSGTAGAGTGGASTVSMSMDAGEDASETIEDASADGPTEDSDAGGGGSSVSVTVNDSEPRLDTTGAIVDAHDGCLKKFGDEFYLYGTAYGSTDGFSNANRYRVYRSPDLSAWEFVGEVLSEPPEGVYYRPYVIFNEATEKYVLWYNWYPTLWNGQFGVATSDKPEGPFTIENDNVAVKYGAPGDPNLFVDDDGVAYLIYTSIANGHSMSIEKLSDDYLSSTQDSSGFLGGGVEAPALFKRGSTYYALFGNLCAFCGGGSSVVVHTAQEPLGPYTAENDINLENSALIVPAQQTFVAEIPTLEGTAYLWMGDLWGSRPDGIKGHDLQYWSPPLVFDDAGKIAALSKVESFSLELP